MSVSTEQGSSGMVRGRTTRQILMRSNHEAWISASQSLSLEDDELELELSPLCFLSLCFLSFFSLWSFFSFLSFLFFLSFVSSLPWAAVAVVTPATAVGGAAACSFWKWSTVSFECVLPWCLSHCCTTTLARGTRATFAFPVGTDYIPRKQDNQRRQLPLRLARRQCQF
ncbi:hypothetical protein BDZ88DRAFT_145095 [Geranomyces variabilis]|nr:hypothetical protein BDZ88DRAFT_145095 [Geranomyces variabilis]